MSEVAGAAGKRGRDRPQAPMLMARCGPASAPAPRPPSQPRPLEPGLSLEKPGLALIESAVPHLPALARQGLCLQGASPWGPQELTPGTSLESPFLSHSEYCRLETKQEGQAAAYLTKRADPVPKARGLPCLCCLEWARWPLSKQSWDPGGRRQPNCRLRATPP